MEKQQALEKVNTTYEQVNAFVRRHPHASSTTGTGLTSLLIDTLFFHTNLYGLAFGIAVTYGVWQWGHRDIMGTQERVVDSTPPMGRIDQQKSEYTFKERLGRLFDPNANGPDQPRKQGIMKEAREPQQEQRYYEDEPRVPEVPRNAPQQQQRQFKENTIKPVFPVYPDDETLKLGCVVETGARFDPHIDQLFGQGMVASAVQGAGKSMLTGVVIEQAGKCGVPVVVFDHKGEYAPIVDLPFINGIRAGSAELRAKIGPACFELTEKNAADFVQLVLSPDEKGQYSQGIIHLPSYGDGWLERAKIVAAVGQALMDRSVRLRELDIKPIPCLVLLDEAQLYVPQNAELLPPEALENKKVLNSLSNAYFALVSNGRSNGYTVLFATPSLTYIAKWAIKSCQIRVLLRHAERNDLEACEKMVGRVATREDIESFPKGTGVIFGFTDKPMIVHFDVKQSRDESETPGLDRLRRRQVQPTQQRMPMVSMETETLPMKTAKPAQGTTTIDLDTILAIMDKHGDKLTDKAVQALFDRLPDVRQGGDYFEDHFGTRNDASDEESLSSRNGMDAFQNYAQSAQQYSEDEPVEQAQQAQELRYTLDEVQVATFCVAYELLGNIDESLKRIGAHTGYRDHARQLIQERNLRKRGN